MGFGIGEFAPFVPDFHANCVSARTGRDLFARVLRCFPPNLPAFTPFVPVIAPIGGGRSAGAGYHAVTPAFHAKLAEFHAKVPAFHAELPAFRTIPAVSRHNQPGSRRWPRLPRQLLPAGQKGCFTQYPVFPSAQLPILHNPAEQLLISVRQAAEVAAEYVLVELFVRVFIPEPARVRRDFVGKQQ